MYNDEVNCAIERPLSRKAPYKGYLLAYPNPAKDNLIIEYDLGKEPEYRFLLFNALGQLTRTINLSNESASQAVPLQGLPAGAYWYTVYNALSGSVSGKIIIHP